MHNPAPVLENDSHKLLWNFNIQTDRLIIIIIGDIRVPADHCVEIKETKKSKRIWTLPEN